MPDLKINDEKEHALILSVELIACLGIILALSTGCADGKDNPQQTIDKSYKCLQNKNFTGAKKLLRQSNLNGKNSPKYAEAQIQLAETLYMEGSVLKAQQHLQRFISEADSDRRILDARAGRLEMKQIFTLEERKLDQKLQDKHCPVCGSEENVIPISYGLIRGNGEKQIERHDLGCVAPFGSPRWWCKVDNTPF